MKKLVFFLCMCTFLAAPAMAETCENNGGTLITAHAATDPGCSPATANTAATCNGKTFCKSDKAMNWWSAFTWCESQGRTLAEFSKMCPGVSQTPANTTGDCPNLQGLAESGWVWSSLAYGSNSAIVVHLSSGAVLNVDGRNVNHYALCE